MRRLIMMTAVVALTAGCWGSGNKKEKRASKALDVEIAAKAGHVANAFRKGDAAGEAALKKAEMSQEEFEAYLYEIAMDAKASEAYIKTLSKK